MNKTACLSKIFILTFALPLSAFAFEIGSPFQSRATADDASAMLKNVSAMGVHKGFELVYKQGLDTGGKPFSYNLHLKYSNIGFGYQGYYEEGLQLNRFTIPLGFPLYESPYVAIYAGAALDIYDAVRPDQKPFTDWRLAALVRCWDFISLGFETSQLTKPDLWGFTYQPRFDVALGVSLFSRLFAVTVDKAFILKTEDPPFVFGLEVEPVHGLILKGFIDTELSFGAGLVINMPNVGLHGSAESYSPVSDNQKRFQNYYFGLRLSEERYRSVMEPSGEVVKIVLDDTVYAEGKHGFLSQLFDAQGLSLFEIIEGVKLAATERRVSGIFIHIKDHKLTMSELAELREALETFKAAGKPVFVYIENAENKDYFLASAATRIYMNPAGSIILSGLSARQTFLKGTLEWIGVEITPVRAGKYKTAVEPFTRHAPSPESEEAVNALLDDLNEQFLKKIATGRNLKEEELKSIIDEKTFFSARKALAEKLVDDIIYIDELEDKISSRLSRHIFITDQFFEAKYRYNKMQGKPVIAVVEVDGAIISGKSGSNIILGDMSGDEDIISAIVEAAMDIRVAAIILRVNSPGGSSIASDKIARAITLARKRKPVVVSMSGEAASGGYYIAAGADYILANPQTVTGSIGVFVMHFSAEELYSKLKLSRAVYKRGERADYDSSWRSLKDDEIKAIQAAVDDAYAQFISTVASGRNISIENVQKAAEGRVWSGKAALEKGLVDKLGGFGEAVKKARELAGLSEREQIELNYLPKKGFSLLGFFAQRLGTKELKSPENILYLISEAEKVKEYEGKPLYLAPRYIEIK